MHFQVLLLLSIAAAVSLAFPAGDDGKKAIQNAFDDRATVESIIDCFTGKITCSPVQKKIKERAMATMRNLGHCPDSYCTPEERAEMTLAMELLERKHPDLWLKLIASMFGIDLGRK